MPCHSLSYGALVAFTNTVLVFFAYQLAHQLVGDNARKEVALTAVFAGVRFLIVASLLAIGFRWLVPSALIMLVGFVVLQFGGQIISVLLTIKKTG